MKKYSILLVIITVPLFLASCNRGIEANRTASTPDHQFPKVVILTTGFEGENATLPQGIVIALQAFNRSGTTVRLEPRDILYKPEQLNNYNVMILSTAPGYHDADQVYSLSYMSDFELQRIREFVEKGGVVIAGDNVGRNRPDGTDRITLYNQLDANNYPLSAAFGVQLVERNMSGFRIYGNLSGGKEMNYMRPETGENFYALIPDTITGNSSEILARWVSEKDTVPAVVKNRYGKGTAYLLASSGLLHPASEGGFLSTARISEFYVSIIEDFTRRNDIPFRLNPWPHGYDYAFCVTLNANGELEQYQRVLRMLKKYKINPDIFVNGQVGEDVREYLMESDLQLQSRGYSFSNYRQFNYSQAIRDIMRNEQMWDTDFSGFRFPFTMTGFWGFVALFEMDYIFESGIGANNLEFIHGSVVPHNIVASDRGYYQSTDMMEIAPTYHDDYFFFKDLDEETGNRDPRAVEKQARLYQKYLENFLEYAIKPYHGALVYQGHPAYVARNDTTLEALENLISMVKSENSWITTIGEIADFRRSLLRLRFYAEQKNDASIITVYGPDNTKVDGITVAIDFQPESVQAARGGAEMQSDSTGYYITFDAEPGQKVTVYR